MHQPTYITLMAIASTWGLMRLISLWFTNKILFIAGLFVLAITIWGAIVQALNEYAWELDWMKLYTIPALLLVVGQFLGLQEMQSEVLRTVGYAPLQAAFPGSSEDYPQAVRNHFLSMIFPIAARGVAGIVSICVKLWSKR